jgi:hypothetical protein
MYYMAIVLKPDIKVHEQESVFITIITVFLQKSLTSPKMKAIANFKNVINIDLKKWKDSCNP